MVEEGKKVHVRKNCFIGIGKHSAWNYISSDNINEEESTEIETFISKMYVCDAHKVNEARKLLFVFAKKAAGAFPSTAEALHLYIKRAQYQVNVCTQAVLTTQIIPAPEQSLEWKKDLSNGYLSNINVPWSNSSIMS